MLALWMLWDCYSSIPSPHGPFFLNNSIALIVALLTRLIQCSRDAMPLAEWEDRL